MPGSRCRTTAPYQVGISTSAPTTASTAGEWSCHPRYSHTGTIPTQKATVARNTGIMAISETASPPPNRSARQLPSTRVANMP